METRDWLLLLPTLAATALYMTMMVAFALAMRRTRRKRPLPSRAPRVSVLKPLAGNDDELEENLESFASLDYPAFDILLGVSSPDDPAFPVARRFLARHPQLRARLVITDADAAINPKVAQLIALDRGATGEVVVISDSNVRVQKGYLWSLVAELSHEGVGLATTVFAGTGERTLGAALENLQLGALIAPTVAAAALLSKRPPTVGKSMAMWRRDLVRLGGFSRVGDVLAEDHALGRLFLDAGFAVRTSLEPVENRNVDCSVKRMVERHTRWSKMRRALMPTAFAFEPFLSPLAIATLVAVAVPSKLTVLTLVFAGMLQTICAYTALRMLRGHSLRWYYAPLELVRTALVMLCWGRACVSRRISWRGHPFVLRKGSVIEPVTPRSWPRLRLRRA